MNSSEIIDRESFDQNNNYFILSEYLGHHKEENKLVLRLVEGRIILEFLSSDIVRVVMSKRDNQVDLSSTPAIIKHDLSYNNFTIEDKAEKLELRTDSLKILINKTKFFLSFYDLEGNLIHQDYSDHSLGWSGDEVRAWKELGAKERFYGLGEKTGYLDKRGRKYTMWNTDTFNPHVPSTDPLYQSIPFLIGFNQGRNYGIYFDNSYKTHFDLGLNSEKYYSFWSEGGKLDYYFINGTGIKDIIKNYTDLTGRMPLPPKWSLGYHQSRYSYHPEEEVKEIAKQFRKKDIPCDVIHLDIHYMDKYKVFTWDEQKFPQPKQMLNDLAEDGFKVVTIIDPGVKKDPRYDLYQEGIKGDYFCKYLDGEYYIGKVWPGECLLPDFTKAEVRRWWGDKHQLLLDKGVKGIWNDMNEPAIFNDSSTMDIEVVHDNDGDLGTHRRFHNLYGLLEGQATYEGLKRYNPNERPFVLTRAGFSGIQRYSAVWTGDNRSFWIHLEMAIPMLMNMGLSGISFCGTDVGGFSDNSDGELLTRWTQLGMFMPFFRNHCAINNINQEPWAFGEDYEKVIRKYIKLRYRFLLHLYNLFYESYQSGLPVMRPLILEYPDDEQTYNLSDQFMVGDSILVAPVYQPDRSERMVYLPEGEWYDFWTGNSYDGGKNIIAKAPLETMPIFIKAGSILPLAPSMNYVDEEQIEELELNIYLSTDVREDNYRLYEDDGISFAYQQGKYNVRDFSYLYEGGKLEFRIYNLIDNHQLDYNNYLIKFKNLALEPNVVMIDGIKSDDWEYNNCDLKISVGVNVSKIEIR
ncbi:glycoside hydrolase family 31 protein [Orenia marismortui]|uniref:Alpha-glucosidase n=1 Tax=Orenia marismortui TaxID=46469 RepID=A0A4V3GYE6_9FIRM|nr:glycoside hydrolase family 31 protein [Orenia marismortui]TDX52110.1 alpha-glucosidase [Orenia marismortui]